jgi:hypothetical protein
MRKLMMIIVVLISLSANSQENKIFLKNDTNKTIQKLIDEIGYKLQDKNLVITENQNQSGVQLEIKADTIMKIYKGVHTLYIEGNIILKKGKKNTCIAFQFKGCAFNWKEATLKCIKDEINDGTVMNNIVNKIILFTK